MSVSKAEQWQEIVSRFKTSGLTQVAFSQRENVPKNRLSYWLRKYSEQLESKNDAGEFIELSSEVVSKPLVSKEEFSRVRVREEHTAAELVFPDGTVLRIRG